MNLLIQKEERISNPSLLNCILNILQDGCPFHAKAYLCKDAEEFDEEMCMRCWSQYAFAVANREMQKKYG